LEPQTALKRTSSREKDALPHCVPPVAKLAIVASGIAKRKIEAADVKKRVPSDRDVVWALQERSRAISIQVAD